MGRGPQGSSLFFVAPAHGADNAFHIERGVVPQLVQRPRVRGGDEFEALMFVNVEVIAVAFLEGQAQQGQHVHVDTLAQHQHTVRAVGFDLFQQMMEAVRYFVARRFPRDTIGEGRALQEIGTVEGVAEACEIF